MPATFAFPTLARSLLCQENLVSEPVFGGRRPLTKTTANKGVILKVTDAYEQHITANHRIGFLRYAPIQFPQKFRPVEKLCFQAFLGATFFREGEAGLGNVRGRR